jgi:hypothetical protein
MALRGGMEEYPLPIVYGMQYFIATGRTIPSIVSFSPTISTWFG